MPLKDVVKISEYSFKPGLTLNVSNFLCIRTIKFKLLDNAYAASLSGLVTRLKKIESHLCLRAYNSRKDAKY